MNIFEILRKKKEDEENKSKVTNESAVVELSAETKKAIFESSKNTFIENFRNNVLTRTIGNIAFNAIELDESFKTEYHDEINNRIALILKEHINFKDIISNPKTVIQTCIVEFAHDLAMKTLKRINEENTPSEVDINKIISADITAEDALSVTTLVDKINGKDASEIIKKKTIDAIADEQERIEAREDQRTEISMAAGEKQEEDGIDSDNADPEINNGADDGSGDNPDANGDGDNSDVAPPADLDEPVEESSLFGVILHKHTYENYKNRGTVDTVEESSLADAVVDYTIYETLNTLRLFDINNRNVNELKKNIISR